MKTDWCKSRHKHVRVYKPGYGMICQECGKYFNRVMEGQYPVDYTTDTALHPFVEGKGDICGGCGEHRNWHRGDGT